MHRLSCQLCAAAALLSFAAAAQELPQEMRCIPAGVYRPLFRANDDPKEVPVKSFAFDVVPVTNRDFLEFVRANPKWQRSNVKRLFAEESYLKHWASDLELGTNASPSAPVTFVSWFAAKAYAQWKGKRLPSVAEWEYAAAASPIRPDGENDPAFVKQIQTWYATPTPPMISAVGLGPTNFFGVQDLHGLVWEWVLDFNTAMVTGDARGDTGLDRQLFCGSGSLGVKDTANFAAFMRYGYRSSLKASYTVHNLGFRCAKDL